MLVYLYHTKSAVVIFIDDSLDACGFSCTAVTVKKNVVSEIKEKVQNANSIVLVDYKGLNVEQDTALRNEFKKNGVDYKVYKNRLLKTKRLFFLLLCGVAEESWLWCFVCSTCFTVCL